MDSANDGGADLIFVISQPRSGSTLLQRILSGHPDVFASAETWLMLPQIFSVRQSGHTAAYEADWARTAIHEYLENYTDGEAVYDAGIRAFADSLYGNALKRAEKKIFLDKTPRYYYIAKDLYRIFPNAKFVFLIRNPLAVLASELTTYVKDNPRFLSSFHDDLLLAPHLILDAIDHLGEDANVIHYEKFVQDPDTQIRNLCNQLGLAFDSQMLNYGKTPAPKGVMNDPVGIHKHSTTSTQSMERWREMAEVPQSRHFAQAYLQRLGPDLLDRLGYNYAELWSALGPAADGPGLGITMPWSVAITPSDDWSMSQRIQLRRYAAIAKQDNFIGRMTSYLSIFGFILQHFFKRFVPHRK
ncbi:MAG: sulfotransferase [Pseudomonadota bacterium]